MQPRLVALVLLFALSLPLVACSDRSGAGSAEETAVADATSTSSGTNAPQPDATATAARPTAAAGSATAAAGGPAEFEGPRAMEHIRQLAETIGPRVAGSPADSATTAYIRDQLRSLGYAAEVEGFEFQDDPYRPGTIEAGGKRYEGFVMSGSEGGDISGESVFIGLGDAAGIGGRDLKGKIAVADRGTLRFGEKAANARKGGAAALLILNNEEGDLLGNLFESSSMPVLGAAGSSASELRAVAKAGGPVTVKAPPRGTTKTANVVARPKAGGKCLVIVGGHHDTVPGAPGAHDNASGTASTIELARAFAADGLDDGLCFATFGAEESGLHGSRALAKQLAAAGELPRIMVNLDTTGIGSRVDLIGTPELTRSALSVAQRLDIPAAITQLDGNFGSDHQSFEDEGVRVLFFATDDIGKLHTSGDTLATIRLEMVERSGDLAYAVIKQLLAEARR